jgi:hypothetical protein
VSNTELTSEFHNGIKIKHISATLPAKTWRVSIGPADLLDGERFKIFEVTDSLRREVVSKKW